MRTFSKDEYDYRVDSNAKEIIETIQSNTFKKHYLTYERTSLDFIGHFHKNRFSIISAFFPGGVACVIRGEVTELQRTQVKFTTSLHVAFRILYWFWLVAMLGVLIFTDTNSSIESQPTPYLLFIGLAIVFRLVIHFVYVYARNHAVTRLKKLIKTRHNNG